MRQPLQDIEIPQRWLIFSAGQRLHRVSLIKWDDDDGVQGVGSTVCGSSGRLSIPGALSRMGLPRCPKCCRALKIPAGNGTPHNKGIKEGEIQ